MSAGKGDSPRNCFSKKFKDNYSKINWNSSSKKQELCRCRWCNKNDIPASEMAMMSYKSFYKGWTGICIKCISSDTAEAEYHRRMERQKWMQEDGSKNKI